MNNSDSKAIAIANKLITQKPLNGFDRTLSLKEFITLYQALVREKNVPEKVVVILMGRNAAVQFVNIPLGRFIVRESRRLRTEDFDKTVTDLVVWGDKLNYSFFGQLKEEKRHWGIIAVIFLIMFIGTIAISFNSAVNYNAYLATPANFPEVSSSIDALRNIGELLMASATLFLSIFVVFTVAQNMRFFQDLFLFKEGLAHKYYRDDVFITRLGLISLAFSIVNTIVLLVPFSFEFVTFSIAGFQVVLNKLSLISPLILSIGAVSLSLCFLSVLYFFERAIGNISTEITEQLLTDVITSDHTIEER